MHRKIELGISGVSALRIRGPLANDQNRYYYFKRVLDLILATLTLVCLLPLFAIIAVLIFLDSSGPVIYSQKRIGARRRVTDRHVFWELTTFTCYKFRTMRTGAGSEIHRQFMEAYIAGNEARMAEMQPDTTVAKTFKLTKDSRVTRVGEFLRKVSLDELPQLWNVVKGDMSLVGPRPPIPYEVEMYSREHLKRLGAKPGITGLWQVNGRTQTSFDEMVRLDIEYIENISIWLDLKILFLTVPAVISGKGAG